MKHECDGGVTGEAGVCTSKVKCNGGGAAAAAAAEDLQYVTVLPVMYAWRSWVKGPWAGIFLCVKAAELLLSGTWVEETRQAIN